MTVRMPFCQWQLLCQTHILQQCVHDLSVLLFSRYKEATAKWAFMS